MGVDAPVRPPRFADALRTRSFAVVFAAELQSVIGDQLARVALSVLVFRETGSAAATGLTFAATFLPAVIGGAVLGHLGDRFRRRTAMVAVDLLRCALFAAMAVPGASTGVLIGLLIFAVFVGPLFGAAEVSYLAAALSPEVFRVATGLRMLGNQGAQVIGFAAGGGLVALLEPRGVLALDAATFLFSVLLVGLAAPREPPAALESSALTGDAAEEAATARAVLWHNHRARALVALSALAGFFVAPEGLAIPFASGWPSPTTRAGFLLAAIPLGSVLGVYVLVRKVPVRRRTAVATAMAVSCGLPLVLSGSVVSFPLALGCWFLSGVFAAYQVEAITQVVQSIPDRLRARSVGICNAILLGAQGIGVALFGSIADGTTAAHAVALAGGLGSLLALLLAAGPLRLRADATRPDRGGRHRRTVGSIEEAGDQSQAFTDSSHGH
jgi:MFS family permease